MKVTILGGAGFLGQKIAAHLVADARVKSLTLFDLVEPRPPSASTNHACQVLTLAGDLVALPEAAIPPDTDLIFHFAAVVSAAAEADYDLGRRVNVRGTDAVIDAARRLIRPPRVVFTSSVASFSGGQGSVLADDARQLPGNSYGAQKAAAELMLTDATRRGFLDAVSIRLPTIIIRPGRPNKAASSFVSAILREPLLGLPTDLPVPDDFAVWVASPRSAVRWLLHAGFMETSMLGADRGINPPGLSVTVAEMLAALETVRPGASRYIHRKPDQAIANIIGTWPAAFTAQRARLCGFALHETLEELVEAFITDDLEATQRDRQEG
jgi:nucleoside-diphosphate-sugar epimerase